MVISNLIAPITYEERIVVFFDVLGWKSHISNAGSDPIKIGQLALIPKLLKSSPLLQVTGSGEAKITSFSDCCVISLPYKEEFLPQIIYGLSNIFIGSAICGFLLRAGVTIGQLHHQEDIVFGPALNKAYQLESKGVFPRIILDDAIRELNNLDIIPDMLDSDSLGLFIDPYKLSFAKSKHLIKNSFPQDDFIGAATNNGVTLYTLLLLRLEEILAKTEKEEHRTRVNWIYARVRQQFKTILGS
ncbi:hypothetical protein [Pseudomonas coronafaciens]|uniref:hypothetical protein n=1 Tax=Pseudomonas coronafaciens TaxID=53409 RepID=UPI000F00039B|nr:hypothetical protein [Pseudomonas coronafaciens]